MTITNPAINIPIPSVFWHGFQSGYKFPELARHSLTSVIGKLLTSIIAKSISEHLDKYNLIKESQHGFSKSKSLMNLFSFYRKVYETVDSNGNYDNIYLDFCKAFDKIPHVRLINKIKSHGIDGKVLNWIESWFGNRHQRVTINGTISEWCQVTSGVPQGAVLGPLLFVMYINDFDNCIDSHISKFADDTKIGRVIRSQTDVETLQSDLVRMND